MLNQISWADYISTIIAVTIVYYLFVATHYYGKDILLYISARSAGSNSISFTREQSESTLIPNELKAFIAETDHADKDSIISGMNYILKRYDIDHTAKDKINTYIKVNCSAHLSDEEMQGIWNR